VGRDITAAAALTRVLMLTAANIRKVERPAAVVLEQFAQTLPEELQASFRERLDDLARLVPDAESAAKALDLAWDHRRIFRDLMIYLDLRPIYKDAGAKDDMIPERIGGFVNAFNLRLSYYQDGDDRTLDMFADVEDLKNMKRQIDRAMAKLTVMREYLRAPHPTALMLMGEDDHVTRISLSDGRERPSRPR
jgi:hypothetical protein